MKKHGSVLSVIFILLISSCSNDMDSICPTSKNQSKEKDGDIIVFKRNSDLPKAVSKNYLSLMTRSASTTEGNSDALLGHGYKLLNGSYIMGDLRNVTFPVINLESIRNYDPTYINGFRVNTTETKVFAYDSYDRYQYNSSVSKKVSSGFSLNLKLFSIGRKKTTTEIFKSVIDNLDEATFGELSLNFISDQFSLQHSDGARKLFSRQFLTRSFIQSLYGLTIQSTLDNYGGFVLTGYLTGGKAYAAYAGCNSQSKDTEGKEKEMEKSINASLTYKTSKDSGKLGFTSSDQTTTSKEFKDKDTYIYIKTFGGNRSGSEAEVKARSMEDLHIDLSSWLQSLNDEDNNTIIDVLDNSLYPLSDFVLETNFKQRIDDTTNGILSPFYDFVTPYIVIERVMVRSTPSYEALYDVVPVLITRQGDRIIFMNKSNKSDDDLRKNANNDYFMERVKDISNNRMNMFSDEIELAYNKKTHINPILRNPLCIVINDFNKADFYRYYYAKTSIEYIYNPKTHVAFSFFIDEDDDEVLDIYGIRKWFENLPENKITIASLANHYNIIGL
ncbi:MAG: MAC/perforin domain-containing protein [Prevotella sp.]|jgi:hypothetical protein|nr:MAC/perforin domain-containing protein [Prevotella sp.]